MRGQGIPAKDSHSCGSALTITGCLTIIYSKSECLYREEECLMVVLETHEAGILLAHLWPWVILCDNGLAKYSGPA